MFGRGRTNQGRFGLFGGRFAPQQKDNSAWFASLGVSGFALGHGSNDGIREFFPTLFLVAVGLRLSNRQDVVDQENSLLGPSLQIPVCRNGIEIRNVRIIFEFLVDIPEGRWSLNASADRKAQTVCLVGPVVGILSNNHQFDLVKWTEIQSGKSVLRGWEYCVFATEIQIEKLVVSFIDYVNRIQQT